MSLIVTVGNLDPSGRPSEKGDCGPVVPEQPPRAFAQTTKYSSVSTA